MIFGVGVFMRLLPVLTSTTLLLILNAGMQSAAQLVAIGNVSGAPFTATWTWTEVETKSGPTETRTIVATAQLARDKNGSTYEALIKDGHTTAIWIVDVLKNRKIEIRPQDSAYHYIPILGPAGKLTTYSVEEWFKILQSDQEGIITHPDHPSPVFPRSHFTALGCRQENGFNLCGVRDEATSNLGEEQIREIWRSDLGLIMSTSQKSDHLARPVNDIQAIAYIQGVTDLRCVEPAPQLFEIPAGYALVPTPPQPTSGR
jgi:hypothetical protein